MPEITEELIRIKARESIIHLVESCEFLDLVEDTDLDARFGDLTPDEAEGAAERVGEAIDTATVTVTWPDRLPGVEPDLHALLDILETGAHDGPALVSVLRSTDGGPDFPEVIDAAECPTFVDRLLEWKNNAVAAATLGVDALGTETVREADPERASFIADARTMLDKLEANPELPLPWRFRGQYTATGVDAEQRAEIDRIAAVLGVTPETRADGGHYAAEVHIGRSSYLALAVTDAHMKRFHEESRLGTEAYEQLHGGAGGAGAKIDAAVESTGHLPGWNDGGALNDNGRDYVEEDAVRRAGREEGEAEQAEESFEDREVAYRKHLAATLYPVTVHYGPYVREQIHGEACAICFRDFKRGEETERYDARDSDAELYRHVTCQPPATGESEA